MRLLKMHTLWLSLICYPTQAQMPTASQIPVGNQEGNVLQLEIDRLLRVSEQDIMAGLTDPGVDIGTLITEKIMDELIKGVADLAVLAPAAEKIMSAYQHEKNQNLAKSIEKLKHTWKDGQERINKIRYQDFKVKYAFQQAMNKAPVDVLRGSYRQAVNESVNALYSDGIPVATTVMDPLNARLMRQEIDPNYPGDDTGWVVLASARSSLLGDDKTLKAKMQLIDKQGQTTYLSPSDRIRLLREIAQESKARRTTILAIDKITSQGLDYYKYRQNRKVYQSKNLRTNSY